MVFSRKSVRRISKLDVEAVFEKVTPKWLPLFSPLILSQERNKMNLTQVQAARICRVKVSTWRAWEYGVNPIPEAMWDYFLMKIILLNKAWSDFYYLEKDEKIKRRTAGESKNEEVEDNWD